LLAQRETEARTAADMTACDSIVADTVPRQPPSDPAGLRWTIQFEGAEAAIADLREALEGLIAEFGAPQELTLTVDVA
jgi:hypothetical protein